MSSTSQPVTVSPARSMKGWSLMQLIWRNKREIKLAIGALGAYLTSVIVHVHDPALAALLNALAALLSWVLACVVDYYVSEVPQE